MRIWPLRASLPSRRPQAPWPRLPHPPVASMGFQARAMQRVCKCGPHLGLGFGEGDWEQDSKAPGSLGS